MWGGQWPGGGQMWIGLRGWGECGEGSGHGICSCGWIYGDGGGFGCGLAHHTEGMSLSKYIKSYRSYHS